MRSRWRRPLTFSRVPDFFWTYTVNGGHVSHFSYPAGSFLLDVPAMALGFHHAVVDWMDLIAWLVSGVLLFLLLPTSLRWLSALVVLTPALLGSFSSGETDAIFLPFLILAVWRWDRFGHDRAAGLARWLGPVALGLACAVKQTPWFCVPILVTGIFLEARLAGRPATRLAIRYVLIVVAVFGAVNLPFVAWHASAWLHGTLIPLVGGLVAGGQGLVSLATHGITGGVDLIMLSVAAALALVTVVAAFAVWYPRAEAYLALAGTDPTVLLASKPVQLSRSISFPPQSWPPSRFVAFPGAFPYPVHQADAPQDAAGSDGGDSCVGGGGCLRSRLCRSAPCS